MDSEDLADDVDGEAAGAARDRLLGRRSPVDRSDSALVSRDYRPRTGGPELRASWPLGPAPGQTEPGDVDWTIREAGYVTLQKHWFTLPYLGGVEHAPLYLQCRGHACTAPGATLSLSLRATHLSGKPYATEIHFEAPEGDHFQSPLVELTPDRPEAYDEEVYAGYELRAKADGGTADVDQGTAVVLYSE